MEGLGWRQICGFEHNGVPVSKWISTVTGMKLVAIETDGPLVDGYFTLATEHTNNDGCPHTLEHLIFMGSELFPVKGMLDQLANRSFAQGTNAWTDTDHTCYTITTAGSEGFLRMLPTYIDHILYPNLTEEAFVTEVHHVTETGESQGVVYCEMQSRENTPYCKLSRATSGLLWEGTNYVWETGGIMADIRALDNATIQKYHRDYYRPNNLCIIVTGKVSALDLAKSMQPMVEKVTAKGGLEKMLSTPPPWQSPVPPLKGSTVITVPFPADEEEDGAMLQVSWRGPAWVDQKQRTQLSCLLKYLTESAVAPVQKSMIDCDPPFANDASYSVTQYSVTGLEISFDGIKTSKLSTVAPKLREVLQQVVDQGIDMSRMGDIIRSAKRRRLEAFESSASDMYTSAVIAHFLYSEADASAAETTARLRTEIDRSGLYDAAAACTEQQWIELLKKWFIDAPSVCVQGQPSKKESEELNQKEKDRVKQLCEELGEQKLKELQAKAEAAIQATEGGMLDGLEDKFPVPKISGITFIPVATYRPHEPTAGEKAEGVRQKLDAVSPAPFPFWIQFDDVKSEFLELVVLMDTQDMDLEMRMYLQLYLEMIYELPIEREGLSLSRDEVVAKLHADAISFESCLGVGNGRNFFPGSFPSLGYLKLKFEKHQYDLAIQWLSDVLWYTKFEAEPIRIVATKLLDDVPRQKRSAQKICGALMQQLNFDPDGNTNVCNFVRQAAFLTEVKSKLESDPQSVIGKLEELRGMLTTASKMRVQCVGNMKDIAPCKTALLRFLPPSQITDTPQLPTKPVQNQQASCLGRTNQGRIAGVAGTESSYLTQSGKALSSYLDPDYPACLVATEYLTALEGPFWMKLRGKGLTYSYRLSLSLADGQGYFGLSNSTNVAKAYKEAVSIVEGYVKGKVLDEQEIEGAKSSVISMLVERCATIESAADHSLMSCLNQIPDDFQTTMLGLVDQVTSADLHRCLVRYIAPLFDPAHTVATVTCNPTKVEEIVGQFAELGRTLELVNPDEVLAQ